MTSLYPKLLSWVDENRLVVLLTVVESSRPQWLPVGAKVAVSESGEVLQGDPGPEAVRTALRGFSTDLLRRGMPRLQSIEIEGESLVVYGEPVLAEPELFLFGGGHCSRAIARVAAAAEFLPVVIEDRPQFAVPEHFPEGTRFHVGHWEEVTPALQFHPNAYIVIVTRAHAYDSNILLSVIDKPYKYLGMIGSRKKVQTVFNRLREQGVSEERIARVHAPIGFKIGAQTPGEIAVSVVAEMIAVKYGKGEG